MALTEFTKALLEWGVVSLVLLIVILWLLHITAFSPIPFFFDRFAKVCCCAKTSKWLSYISAFLVWFGLLAMTFAFFTTFGSLVAHNDSDVLGATICLGGVGAILVIVLLMYIGHPHRKYYTNNVVVFLELSIFVLTLGCLVVEAYLHTTSQFTTLSMAYMTLNFFCILYVAFAGQPSIELEKLLAELFKGDVEADDVEEFKPLDWRGATKPRWRPLIIAYSSSLAVLLAYGMSVYAFETDGLPLYDGSEFVGLYVGAAVVWYDLFVLVMKRKRVIRASPETTLSWNFGCRLLLIAFGLDRWYIGQACVYFLFSLYVGINAVDSYYPVEGQAGKLRALKHAKTLNTREDGRVSMSTQDLKVVQPFFKSPVGLLTIMWIVCTVPFVVLLLLVEAGTVAAPDILIDGAVHEQVEFGYGALFFSLAGVFGYGTYRAFNYGTTQRGGNSRPFRVAILVIQAGIFWAFCAGFGGVFYAITDSIYVISSSVFVAPMLIAGVLWYRTWKLNNYMFAYEDEAAIAAALAGAGGANGTNAHPRGSKVAPEDVVVEEKKVDVEDPAACPPGPEEADVAATTAVDDNPPVLEDVVSADVRSDAIIADAENPTEPDVPDAAPADAEVAAEKPASEPTKNCCADITQAQKRTALFALLAFFYCACSLSWGLWIFAVEDEVDGVWFMFAPIILAGTYVSVIRYFRTEVFGAACVVGLCVTAIPWALLAALIWVTTDRASEYTDEQRNVRLFFVLLLYPALVVCAAAVYKYRLDGKHSKMSINLDIAGLVLLEAFAVVVALVYDTAIGLGLAGGLLVLVYCMIAFGIWYKKGFRAPKKLQIATALLVLVVIAGGIVLGFITERAFEGFTVAWLTGCGFVAFATFSKFVNTSGTRSAFSAHFFPMFTFQIDTGNLLDMNKTGLLYFGALYGVAVWGVIAQFNLDTPATGTAVACGAMIAIGWSFFALVFRDAAVLARTSEFIEKDTAKTLKNKAQEKYGGTEICEKFGIVDETPDDFMPPLTMPEAQKRLAAARKALNEAPDAAAVHALYLVFARALFDTYDAFRSDNDFQVYFRLLLIMAGEFMENQMNREIIEFASRSGIPGVTTSDLRSWHPTVLAQIRKEIEADRAQRKAKAKILAEEEKKRPGKRKNIALKPGTEYETVMPIVSDADIEKCKQTVATIIQKSVATGKPFTDDDFVPYKASRYFDNWRRMQEINTDAKVICYGDIRPEDLNQGSLGDCWFIASMANVAAYPQAIKDLFLSGNDQKAVDVGVYAVKFYNQGRMYYVIVDDRIPTDQTGMNFAYCKARGTQTARDAPVEMWPTILEKAYAKLFNTENNGWEQLEGGLCSLGMADLTGMASINFRHSASSERVISGRLWKDLLRMHSLGFFIGASSAGESDTKKSQGNIVERHAFSILDVREVSGFKLVQLRNPWGCTEWTGDWSDNSPMWDKYPQVKKAVNLSVADDGLFWMAFEDYVRHYDGTSVTFFSSSGFEGLHTETVVWEGPPEGYETGGSWRENMTHCPQAWLTVGEQCDVAVAIKTPKRRIPDKEVDPDDSGDYLGLICAHEGKVRLHSSPSGGRMINVFNDQYYTTITMMAESSTPYNLLACYRENTKQTPEFVYPLEVSITVAKRFADSVNLEKCPANAPVQKQTTPNLFSADELRG